MGETFFCLILIMRSNRQSGVKHSEHNEKSLCKIVFSCFSRLLSLALRRAFRWPMLGKYRTEHMLGFTVFSIAKTLGETGAGCLTGWLSHCLFQTHYIALWYSFYINLLAFDSLIICTCNFAEQTKNIEVRRQFFIFMGQSKFSCWCCFVLRSCRMLVIQKQNAH